MVLFCLLVDAAYAISLGRPRGLATISRPLDMPIAARLDTAEALRPDCLSAEVFFGDRRVAPGDARVTVERSGDALDVMLRVRTRTPVDEPVVTVFVQAGCELASTRRYVFLAEPPTVQEMGTPVVAGTVAPAPLSSSPSGLPAGQAPPMAGGGLGVDPAVAPAASRRVRNRSGMASVETPLPERAAVAPRQDVVQTRKPAGAAPRDGPARPEKMPARPRLTLEPVDLQTDRPLGLKPSTVLTGETLGDSPETLARRQAARDLWAAINSTPEERISQTQRLEDLDKRVAAMGQQLVQLERRTAQANAATEQARAERYRNPLVYGLGVLAVVLAVLAGWLALNRRQTRSWWQPEDVEAFFRDASSPDGTGASSSSVVRVASAGRSGEEPVPRGTGGWRRKLWGRSSGEMGTASKDAASSNDDAVPPVRSSAGAPLRRSPSPGPASIPSELGDAADGLKVDTVSPSTFDRSLEPSSKPLPGSTATVRKVTKSSRESALDELDIASGGARRAVNVEELLDVHQQVEFFATLGEFERAAELLSVQLDAAPDSSALLYLDLLDLYRKADNKEAYEQTKRSLEQRFAVKAPEWDDDSSHGRTLEEYEQAMQRITALWPSPKVLAVIEESLMHRPESPEQAFDLPAYRELLMLYSVALSVVDNAAAEAVSDPELVGKAVLASELKSEDPQAVPAVLDDGKPREVDVLLDFSDSLPSGNSGFGTTQIEPLQATVGLVVDSEPPQHLGLDLDLSMLDPSVSPAHAEVSEETRSQPKPGPDNNLIDFQVDDPPAGGRGERP
jgi:hypothetical protein